MPFLASLLDHALVGAPVVLDSATILVVGVCDPLRSAGVHQETDLLDGAAVTSIIRAAGARLPVTDERRESVDLSHDRGAVYVVASLRRCLERFVAGRRRVTDQASTRSHDGVEGFRRAAPHATASLGAHVRLMLASWAWNAVGAPSKKSDIDCALTGESAHPREQAKIIPISHHRVTPRGSGLGSRLLVRGPPLVGYRPVPFHNDNHGRQKEGSMRPWAKRLAAFLVCLGVMTGMASGSWAINEVYGPFPDFKGFTVVTLEFIINTWVGITIKIPFDGRITIGRPDRWVVKVNVIKPIFVATYIKIVTTSAPFNLATDNLTVTDITAIDLNPGGDPALVPPMTGFNAVTPEVEPIPGEVEEFTGISGTIYSAGPVVTSRIGDLGTLLPGYDISSFTGDPDSVVYVSQAVIPANDFAVPALEIPTLSQWGVIGLILLMAASALWMLRRRNATPRTI